MTDIIPLDRKLAARRRLPPPKIRRAIREAVGATQADIADELGIHRETVSRWESGERTPRGEKLVHYVELLDRLQRTQDVPA